MKASLVFALLSICLSLAAQQRHAGFHFVDQIDQKEIHVLFNDTLLTAYQYGDSLMKPVLHPLTTRSGKIVTRGYPIAPRDGERVDHPHHIGMWLTYESINGIDFWNNSTAIPYSKRAHYGRIVHDGIVKTDESVSKAVLEVTARWIDHDGKILLRETTSYTFRVQGKNFIVDRRTTLDALDQDVQFKDVKDGLLGIRVARELEQPSTEPAIFLDNKGNVTEVPPADNKAVTGEYLSSAGLKGDAVWGTRATWTSLRGILQGDSVSITVLDHPRNPGYPTYWHARGYGLFAANPLGQEIFSKGKEKLNFKLGKGEAVTFQYRVIIHEGGTLPSQAIDAFQKDFH